MTLKFLLLTEKTLLMRQEKKYFGRKKEEDLDVANTFEKIKKPKKENFKLLGKKLQIAMTPEKLK